MSTISKFPICLTAFAKQICIFIFILCQIRQILPDYFSLKWIGKNLYFEVKNAQCTQIINLFIGNFP